MKAKESRPPGSLQRVVRLHPPKRLEALAEMLRDLREWAWLEAKIETDKSKQRIWLDVRDWAIGKAKQKGIAEEFLHGAAPAPKTDELPQGMGLPETVSANVRGRPMQPNDPSSATRPTGRNDCNRSAMAGFAAAHG